LETHFCNNKSKYYLQQISSKICEQGASGGVEPEAEILGVAEMKGESKNASDDLPNQEKNQY